jgi:hypothetical protein
LIESVLASEAGFAGWRAPLAHIAERGCLARRISEAAGSTPTREDLQVVYGQLADCLSKGELFAP